MGYNRPGPSFSGSNNGSNSGSNRSDDSPPKSEKEMVRELDKRMKDMQSSFQEALNMAASKETEKFDLILSILGELQSRQADLEESFKGLTTQLSMANIDPTMQAGQTSPMNGTMAMGALFQQQGLAMMANGTGQQGTMMMNGDMNAQQMMSTQMVAAQQMTPKGAFPVILPNGQMQYVTMQQPVAQMQNMQQMQYMDTSGSQQDQSQNGMSQ